MERKQPNLVVILADDLGYGDLGCYGQQRIKTPNIDRLAREGMRFTQFYAGSTVCAPSRAVLMTGIHTGRNRIRGNEQHPLLPEDVTIAEVLEKGGYQTAAFGKWGLGKDGSTGVPTKQGFMEWRGYLEQVHAHNYYPSNLYRGLDPWEIGVNAGGRKGLYVQDLFTLMTTNFISTAMFRPFFLYLPFTLPHAHNALGRATGNGMEVPNDSPYSGQNWPQPEKNKAAMITRLDASVGAILAALEMHRMQSNTLVLFTSDNGPHSEGGVKAEFHRSSGPLRGIKRDLYEGGIRVPMIAWHPGKIPAGVVSDQIWAMQDILPTFAEAAGLPVPKGIDGISMLRCLRGLVQTNQHSSLYWEFHEGGSKQALRAGEWKAVKNHPEKPLELYHLPTDIGETNNVAAQHQELAAQLETRLKASRTDHPLYPLRAPSTPKPSSQ